MERRPNHVSSAIVISFIVTSCSKTCNNDSSFSISSAFNNNLYPSEFSELVTFLLSTGFKLFLYYSQFDQHGHLYAQNPDTSMYSNRADNSNRVVRDATGSGFNNQKIKYLDTLDRNSAKFPRQVRNPEGDVFLLQLSNDMFLENGKAAKDLRAYQISLTTVAGPSIPNSVSASTSWIAFDSKSLCINGLPSSLESGFQQFYLELNHTSNPRLHGKFPLEILVFKNKDLPNHLFQFEFQYDFTEFNSNISVKIAILRKIADFLDVKITDLTVDNYSHEKGKRTFSLSLFKKTIGNSPCSSDQQSQIRVLKRKLIKLSSSQDNIPSDGIRNALSEYNLRSVRRHYVNACKVAMQRPTPSSTTVDPFGAETVSSQMQLGTSGNFITFPIVMVASLAFIVFIITLGVVYRQKFNACCIKKHQRLSQSETFVGVKTRNLPVVFADEIDELSCSNLSKTGTTSYRIDRSSGVGTVNSRGGSRSPIDARSGSRSQSPPPPPPINEGELSLPIDLGLGSGSNSRLTLLNNQLHVVTENLSNMSNSVGSGASQSPDQPTQIGTMFGMNHIGNHSHANHNNTRQPQLGRDSIMMPTNESRSSSSSSGRMGGHSVGSGQGQHVMPPGISVTRNHVTNHVGNHTNHANHAPAPPIRGHSPTANGPTQLFNALSAQGPINDVTL